MRSSLVLLVALAACAGDDDSGGHMATTGGTWTNVSAATRPLGRISGHMVGRPDGTAILFGGTTSSSGIGGTLLSDTWQYDGATGAWQQLQIGMSPSGRFEFSMAAFGDSVILFGGTGGGIQDDTWKFEAGAWTPILPAHRPPPRQTAGMAQLGTELVMFGGVRLSTGKYADTWVFDGTDWTQKTPTTSPPARSYVTMVTVGDRILMYGGGDGLWQWKDDDWTLIDPAAPAPGSAAITGRGDGLVVVGGSMEGTTTWTPTGGWKTDATGAPPLRAFPMATTLSTNDVILFGGENDTSMPPLDETWRYR